MEKDFNPNTAGMFTLANHLYVSGWTKWNTRATRREFWLGGLGVLIYALPLIVPYIYSMDFDVYAFELEENPFAMFTPPDLGLDGDIEPCIFCPGNWRGRAALA